MPYIKESIRLNAPSTRTDGELNYAITCLINGYIEEHGKGYSTLNSAIGVLECAKLELYRRIVAPYEDTKIIENGDVYSV